MYSWRRCRNHCSLAACHVSGLRKEGREERRGSPERVEAGGGLQIFTDSKGLEALVGNLVQLQLTKNIGAPYHYVRQLVQEGVVNFQQVASKDNAADVLTKGNSRPFHSMACHKFGFTVEVSPVFIHR